MSVIVEEKKTHTVFHIADGVFIRETVRELMSKVKVIREKGKTRFIIDFTQCEYISSEGLGAVSGIWKDSVSQPDGKLIIVFNPDPENEVRYLFDTIGLSEIMKGDIFTDPDEAERVFE